MVDHIPSEGQAATETSAHIAVVEGRVGGAHAKNRGNATLYAECILGAGPNLCLAVFMQMHSTVHRLHGRVGKIRHAVIRLYDVGCGLERGFAVAEFAIFVAVAAGETGIELFEYRFARNTVVGRLFEHRLNIRERHLGPPVAVCNHSDGIFELNDALNASAAQHIACIHRNKLGAEYWRKTNGGVQHALGVSIDAVGRRAIDLGRNIVT